ncbi:MAG: hypothetical protein JSV80_12570 [Acidobacteriota bacterium]|nr:MAG: hypothetical protein JSV80_12570 [Acidobacteriota bacterium]
MSRIFSLWLTLLIALLVPACSRTSDEQQPANQEVTPSQLPAPIQLADAEKPPVPDASTDQETAEEPVPAAPSAPAAAAPDTPVAEPVMKAEPTAAREPSPPVPKVEPAAVKVPSERVSVEPSKSGLTRIGSEKCGMCHKVQLKSWAETAHAKLAHPLECESCHGPGSEYKKMSIMKDPELAKQAGLIMPGKEFCVVCHVAGWSDDLLTQVHAHKGDA